MTLESVENGNESSVTNKQSLANHNSKSSEEQVNSLVNLTQTQPEKGFLKGIRLLLVVCVVNPTNCQSVTF